MQLKLSHTACLVLLSGTVAYTENYVSIQYMGYDEESGKTTVHSPQIELNKEFGTDYVLHLSLGHDSLSGASPTMYDGLSGASASIPPTTVYPSQIRYGYVPYDDNRTFYSGAFTMRFANRDELTIGGEYSYENDYTSRGISAEYLHYLDESKNRSVSLGVSYQKDDVDIHCFLGGEECDTTSGASAKTITKDLDALQIEVGFSQVLNMTSLVKGSIFYSHEEGYLSNPYMHVVRDKNKIVREAKPEERNAYGATLEYSKALNEALNVTLFYRLYHDSWEIWSHTIGANAFCELNDKWTFGIGGRYYVQTAAYFYSGSKTYFTDEKYASSDRRMDAYSAYDVHASVDHKLTDQITVKTSAGYYVQPSHFDAVYYTVGLKYSF